MLKKIICLYIGTFDTVEASITSFSETSVCIKCSLRADSTMTGCLAIFEDHEDNILIKYAIQRVPDEVIAYECFHNLQDGVYKVSVTDMTFYDSHEDIAFVLSNNLIIKNEHSPSGKTCN